MSSRRTSDGAVPIRRCNLPRNRVNVRLEFRRSIHAKILRLSRANGGDRPDSVIAVLERIVEQFPELPDRKS